MTLPLTAWSYIAVWLAFTALVAAGCGLLMLLAGLHAGLVRAGSLEPALAVRIDREIAASPGPQVRVSQHGLVRK